jgi:ribonuclease P/MRP protein subunit POP5
MVRVKFRYLVCQILYPSPTATTPSTSSSTSSSSLPPTLQIYAPTPDAFHSGALIRHVRDAVADLYGDYGSGMVSSSLKGTPSLSRPPFAPQTNILSLLVPYFSPSTSTFILRCPRDHYALVWAALTLTTSLPRVEARVVIRVVRVSGTIRKAEEDVLRRARALVKRVREGEVRAGEAALLTGVARAVERARREEDVLARVDADADADGDASGGDEG